LGVCRKAPIPLKAFLNILSDSKAKLKNSVSKMESMLKFHAFADFGENPHAR
jgi:hypothetical protein